MIPSYAKSMHFKINFFPQLTMEFGCNLRFSIHRDSLLMPDDPITNFASHRSLKKSANFYSQSSIDLTLFATIFKGLFYCYCGNEI